jgi:hypothetical protein
MRYAPAAALIAFAALTGQVFAGQAAAQAPSADPPPMKAEDTPQTTPQAPPAERPPREMQQNVGPEQKAQQPEAQPSTPQQAQQPTPQQPAPQQAQQPAPQQAQPPAPQQAPASAQRPESPAGAPLGSAQQQRDGHEATQTRSGIGGKQEPSASTPARDDSPVLVDGRLNVPGAPVDSQTVPAKFSEGNAALDKLPIMAFPLALSDEQKQKLVAAIRAASPDAAIEKINPKLTEELPVTVTLHEMPLSANELGVGHYKYVRLPDRILLVTPANRIVAAEIKE